MDTEDYLDTWIAAIEANKARVRIEYDNLKKDYLAGQYRQHGLTKRECEDRLTKRNGEVLGHEAALAFLYVARSGFGEDENDGS